MPTLRSKLNYEPKELQFGTSGRRGLIVDLTQLEIKYMQSISEFARGAEFAQTLRRS